MFRSKPVLETQPMLFVCGMSRCGTTLLATVFDAHPQITMGYELIPPPGPSPAEWLERLDSASHIFDDADSSSEHSTGAGGESKDEFIRFFLRCRRAGLDQRLTRIALQDLTKRGIRNVKSVPERLTVAWRLARARRDDAASDLFGFKLNIPSVSSAHELFPNGNYIFITRDPRDVVASHRVRNFDRTLAQVCEAWLNYLTHFQKFQAAHPRIASIINYEDLVSQPRPTLDSIFERLPVPMDNAVLRFYESQSQASVHAGNHPNKDQLRQSFFTSSIGRWRETLTESEANDIMKLCGPHADRYNLALA